MIFQRFAVVAALLLSTAMLFAVNSVDVRLSPQSIDADSHTLYVDIEMRTNNATEVVLAGQNYRVYFPSDKVSLDSEGSRSKLNNKKYEALHVADVYENINAAGRGPISFDNNLGFVNLSVDLKDMQSGGLHLTKADGWVSMVTLKFDVKQDIDELKMILGRSEVSGAYATAFVEVAGWQGPQEINKVEIEEYFDLDIKMEEETPVVVDYQMTVGPNPSSDYVEFRSVRALQEDLTVTITDVSGKLIRSESWGHGTDHHISDVSDLSPATYQVVLTSDSTGGLVLRKQIVVAS